MARQEQVELVDDIDGGRADETVRFALDGASYEIDLSRKRATALRKSLAEFVTAARPTRPARATAVRRPRPGNDVGATAAQIREWAAAQGIAISERGRVADSVREQYRAAHQ
ncbi:histone-like nucleoid-structuring protein Lsr2 [Nakamurella endophytica]|uniref:Lsr2 family protein n=1 Tax=Nakamurella endophytica TaxID=1748367 RepID=A0A917T1M9_9ACTN|nr:Lsr2 family protein [Nakamurella endophytica]GGM05815.1 Lsr2 family protein [Nakamurella endophytica]